MQQSVLKKQQKKKQILDFDEQSHRYMYISCSKILIQSSIVS